jgi:hypothetical protein
MFHEKRHEKALEKKLKEYHHTVTPLEIDFIKETKEQF